MIIGHVKLNQTVLSVIKKDLLLYFNYGDGLTSGNPLEESECTANKTVAGHSGLIKFLC